VINRLEDFAAAVNDRLDTIDFDTKREIIRALIKRIEIHKDDIVVVFRVEPGPGPDVNGKAPSNNGSANNLKRTSSMPDRWGRCDPALWRPFVAVADLLSLHDPGIQPLADQPQYSTIIDPLLDEAP
jgi:site-specific DNA recombinase